MHYSDEEFEAFSAGLEKKIPAGEILWHLRDVLFNAMTYRSASEKKVPSRNRFGIWGYGLWWLLKGRPQRGADIPLANLLQARQAFLFLEARDAHFMTLFPLLEKADTDGMALLADDAIRERLTGSSAVQSVAGQWVYGVRLRDFCSAARLMDKARRLVGSDFGPEAQGRLTEYLIQFFGWERFWRQALGPDCETVCTTSESAPVARALFSVAKERGLRRVHWCHGFRHATWQVTLASELVCHTEGDVRYFSGRVPSDCTVVCRPNPRVLETARAVGMPRMLNENELPNILFMSQGPESPYTPEMRIKDLQLLKRLVAGRNALLRVRPHPRENPDLLRAALAEAGVGEYELSGGGLVDDLQWADIVGTSWSTGLLEAHACGRECVWINAQIELFPIVQELIDEGVGILYERHES